MSLRQKLLLLFSLTVAAAVAAVAWTVLIRVRHVFELRDQEETALFVSQFQREFQQQSTQVSGALSRLAETEHTRAMAFEIVQSGDAAPYLTEAQTMAQEAHLDFLEIIGPEAKVVSSAQWPARFGYAEPAVALPTPDAFLKYEDLPDGSRALGLFSVHAIPGAEPAVKLVGGRRLDQGFLADLPIAPGMAVGLYSDGGQANPSGAPAFDVRRLIGATGEFAAASHFQSLIDSSRTSGKQASQVLYLSDQREDSVNATAIPLKSDAGQVLAVLVVSFSRSSMVEAQQHIRNIAYGVAAAGILLAVVFSLWIAARVSRPIEQLALAAESVAGGDWDVRVPVNGSDEVSVLASSFNHMTEQLASQRNQLVQTERVAAWRELARRLAHELKNPLFPLQLTVENLIRARDLSPSDFDEVFRESTTALSMEIANLKTIIGRFSDFSKKPKPELEKIDAKSVIDRVRTLYESTAKQGNAGILFETDVAGDPMPLLADPELLHRALSNLVLNAMDAMPEGGKLTMSAHPSGDKIEFRVSDTGEGLTPEECQRLFTPYYTTKQHGTGLGLAIVQSVVADHAGTITVESSEGGGATFIITLPRADT
ncbi:MAG TPA: ATP-binding protein [Terracidiphilus sp.]|nr:ATP-binding protein [Terracidiphilus sp.]